MAERRWEPAVSFIGPEAEKFLAHHLKAVERNTLLICGAGFDPRAPIVAELLSSSGARLVGCLVSETRPPDLVLRALAAANLLRLHAALPNRHDVKVNIFDGSAVVGGRNVVNSVSKINLADITDIVVDLSALSVGTAFPIIRYFVELHDTLAPNDHQWNLHVVAVHHAALDASIHSKAMYEPDYVHGFRGGATLTDGNTAARMWLPQLAPGLGSALAALHKFVEPDDTCPILPFPAADPRTGDGLLDEYDEQLSNAWAFDPRNIVLAAEDDPLDLYRTLVTLNQLRTEVFQTTGGSRLVLSPLGSKVTALGALMAALEEDMPIAYLESGGYNYTPVEDHKEGGVLVHVWLEGEAYPAAGRPRLKSAVE